MRRRGFTLIETMVVIAILGVLAALTVPAFLPMVREQELRGAAEQVASVMHRARMRAIADRRCTRVFFNPVATQAPAVITAQVMNTYDCGDDVGSPPNEWPSSPLVPIDSSVTNHWITFATLTVNKRSVRIEWEEAPTDTRPHPDPADSEIEVRFRPTGRLYSSNATLTNDDGLVKVSSTALPNDYFILVDAAGPICLVKGVMPPGSANNRSCP